MPDRTLADLERRLLTSGVAPRHVRRLRIELDDHLDDLRNEAIQAGQCPDDAAEWANEQLGDPKWLAEQVLANAELRTWAYRYPRIACIYYPFACLLLLPMAPVFAGLGRPSIVARWGAALLMSATVTAGMMLVMGLSIALG